MALLLNRGQSRSTPIVPKVVVLYAEILKAKDDATATATLSDAFFNELLLMKPRSDELADMLAKLTGTQLLAQKQTLNTFSSHCLRCALTENGVRIINSLTTIGALVRGVCRRHGHGHDMIDAVVGADHADERVGRLFARIGALLEGDYLPEVKQSAVGCLLTIFTAHNEIDGSALIEYAIAQSLFDPLVHVLAARDLRHLCGRDVVVVLAVLVNYRKYDNANPYIVRLSLLDDQLALIGYSQVIGHHLHSHNEVCRARSAPSSSRGVMAGMSDWLGGMITTTHPDAQDTVDVTLLLALYEMVHLNRNFISMLVSSVNVTRDRSTTDGVETTDEQAVNVLSALFTYSSLALHDLRTEASRDTAKLCVIILTCIADDQLGNALMHDVSLSLRVPLYKVPMRHRTGAFTVRPHHWPLACSLLDLCHDFLTSHLMKNLPFDLFTAVIGVIHRVLVYERRFQVRLQYSWRKLWNGLLSVLKFVTSHESSLRGEHDIFHLCHRLLCLINLFITFGDTFLPSPLHYDHLYYEIVRNGATFDALHVLVSRELQRSSNGLRSTDDSSSARVSPSAHRCATSLINVRAIVNGIRPSLPPTHEHSVTEAEVLEMVRVKYDTLSLRLYDNLDVVEPYVERTTHAKFFHNMLKRVLTNDTK